MAGRWIVRRHYDATMPSHGGMRWPGGQRYRRDDPAPRIGACQHRCGVPGWPQV